jgi:hypothetical protein
MLPTVTSNVMKVQAAMIAKTASDAPSAVSVDRFNPDSDSFRVVLLAYTAPVYFHFRVLSF